MSVYIIAEAGVNHNGSVEQALRLCDAAQQAGVDAVKFQTFKTENILVKDSPMAEYQKTNTGSDESQFDMVKKLELSFEDFKTINQYCKKIGIEFLSTPDDEESLDFLIDDIGLDIIKVGSGEVNNIPYLRSIGSKNRKVILSTGMSTIGEVETAYNELLKSGALEVILLHCTTNYPCPPEEVNLLAMNTLRDTFKCSVGYSDHTLGIQIPIAAVALGAEIIEKHFTLDKDMPGPDHKASLNPLELKEMTDSIRQVETALGDGIKKPNPSEVEVRKVIQRSIVASKEINAGETLSEENLTTKRASSKGIPSGNWDEIVGSKAHKSYQPDELIER